MRLYPAALFLIVISVSSPARSQVWPRVNGGCGVTSNGTYDCDWHSVILLRREGAAAEKEIEDGKWKLVVTRYTLAPGAPLDRMGPKYDNVVVGMNQGQLANETKSPRTYVSVTEGLVMLMPKEEKYRFRNIGKENLDLLVIELRK